MTDTQKQREKWLKKYNIDGAVLRILLAIVYNDPQSHTGRKQMNTQNTVTLSDILSMQFNGNHFQDRRLFDQIDAFVVDSSTPMSDKIQALQHLCSKGMGIDNACTQEQVEEYLIGVCCNNS